MLYKVLAAALALSCVHARALPVDDAASQHLAPEHLTTTFGASMLEGKMAKKSMSVWPKKVATKNDQSRWTKDMLKAEKDDSIERKSKVAAMRVASQSVHAMAAKQVDPAKASGTFYACSGRRCGHCYKLTLPDGELLQRHGFAAGHDGCNAEGFEKSGREVSLGGHPTSVGLAECRTGGTPSGGCKRSGVGGSVCQSELDGKRQSQVTVYESDSVTETKFKVKEPKACYYEVAMTVPAGTIGGSGGGGKSSEYAQMQASTSATGESLEAACLKCEESEGKLTSTLGDAIEKHEKFENVEYHFIKIMHAETKLKETCAAIDNIKPKVVGMTNEIKESLARVKLGVDSGFTFKLNTKYFDKMNDVFGKAKKDDQLLTMTKDKSKGTCPEACSKADMDTAIAGKEAADEEAGSAKADREKACAGIVPESTP